MTADKIDLRVLAQDGGSSDPLPQWARDLRSLGERLGEVDDDQSIQVCAVAVPRIEYAAGLAAYGVTRARLKRHEWTDEEMDRHWARIASLPAGSPVFLRRGDRVLNGVFHGLEARAGLGDQLLKVQVENEDGGNTSHLVRPKDARRIIVAPAEAQLPKRQKGRRTAGLSDFISTCLGTENATIHVERRRVDVVVLGVRSRIRRELQEDFLVAPSENAADAQCVGCLAELIRPRDLMPKRQGYASRVLSARPGVAERAWLPPTAVMIFDGASAFLRARPLVPRRPTLVLLARGESRFYDAVDVLNRLAAGGSGEQPFFHPQTDALEIYAYSVRRPA